jgi:hypothetical protein
MKILISNNKAFKGCKNIIRFECYKYLELDNKAKQLDKTYIKEKVLGRTSHTDGGHVAATVLTSKLTLRTATPFVSCGGENNEDKFS